MTAEGIEYLSEWPPQDTITRAPKGQKRRVSEVNDIHPHKEVKIDRSQFTGKVMLSVEENELVSRPSSTPVSTILTLWWKLNLRSGKNNHQSDLSEHNSLSTLSRNPHTLLHHISKYI